MSTARVSSAAVLSRIGFLALPLLLVAPGVGCDKEEKPADLEEKKEAAAPKIKVELPPSPDFDEGKVDLTYPDGSVSIYGLRTEIDENVKKGDAGTEVMVKGYVQEIYVAPECPEGEICPPPKQPHVWITDKPDQLGKKRAMMVVNYRFSIPEWDAKRWKEQPDVIFEKGKQYSFKGKFKRFSDTGFAFDRGLLEFVAYKAHDPETGAELDTWVYPPGAPWHPLEVQRQDEENAELAAKAKAALDKKKGG